MRFCGTIRVSPGCRSGRDYGREGLMAALKSRISVFAKSGPTLRNRITCECFALAVLNPPAMAIACNAVTGPRISNFPGLATSPRSEEHTSELQSLAYLVCRLLLEKKKKSIELI